MQRLLISLFLVATASASAQTSSPPFVVQAVADPAARGLATLWNDVDDDGDVDLLVLNVFGDPTLFQNDGAGGLTTVPFPLSTFNVGDGVFADLDGDGDDDLLVGSLGSSEFYQNDGGTLSLATLPGFTGLTNVRHVDVLDINGDGLLDLFLSRRNGSDRVLTQTGDGGWTTSNVASPGGGDDTNMACWVDLDRDGDLDAFIVSSAGTPNAAYQNNDGVLVQRRLAAEGDASVSSTSCDWGDADGDGDLDLLVTGTGPVPVRLYLNERIESRQAPERVSSDHGFERIVEADGAFPLVSDDIIAGAWIDADGDGDLDVITTGRNDPLRLFENDGFGSFTQSVVDGPSTPPSYRTGLAPFDVDDDGDLDLAVAAGFDSATEPSFVLRNTSPPGRWLGVQLEGRGGNQAGIGARITVYATLDSGSRALVRDVLAHQNRLGQSPRSAHVGLGESGVADSVRVDWPSGAVSRIEAPELNQVLTIAEPGAEQASAGAGRAPEEDISFSVAPNPSAGATPRARVVRATSGEAVFSLYDSIGREVWSQTSDLVAGRTDVDLPRLPSGTYVLRVRFAGGTSAAQTFTVVR